MLHCSVRKRDPPLRGMRSRAIRRRMSKERANSPNEKGCSSQSTKRRVERAAPNARGSASPLEAALCAVGTKEASPTIDKAGAFAHALTC